MTRYLLSIYQPEGDPPPRDVLDPVMRDLKDLNQEMREAGVWVFDAGLGDARSARWVRVRGDRVLTTDGPYAESKEFVGGFVVIDVADRDRALEWATRLARASTLPVEVRPFNA